MAGRRRLTHRKNTERLRGSTESNNSNSNSNCEKQDKFDTQKKTQ